MKFWIRSITILIIGLGLCAGSYYTGKSSIHKLLHWETVQVNIPFFGSVRSSREKVMVPFTYAGKSYEVKAYVKDLGRYESVIFPKEDPSKAENKEL